MFCPRNVGTENEAKVLILIAEQSSDGYPKCYG